jgi:hypothetical protein
MRRDLVLLDEMIEAAERVQDLCDGVTADDLEADRLRRDAVLWNFTVLGEAAGQLSEDLRSAHPRGCVAPADRTATPSRPWLLVDRHRDPRVDRAERFGAIRR